MLKRLRILSVLFVMLFALMSSGVVIAQGPPTDRPENPRAFPPFHVRGLAASSTPVNGYTPSQMRAAYGFDSLKADGAGQIIAIVDAYDDPTAASDLDYFSTTFGLPSMNTSDYLGSCPSSPQFKVVYASGSRPATDGGWALETSLDVQWAHAIAPCADIVLVEANDAYLSSLLTAVDAAVRSGASVVSMSWGAKDFYSESGYDSHFKAPAVSFVAASGDSGNGTIYPATSPFVLAVGGTTLQLSSSGTWSETAWSGSGGGASKFEAEPGYQSSFPIPNTRGKRGSPDVAYNADPNTGVPVYDSTAYNGSTGWWQVGGTSAGAPQWAALIALADELGANPLSINSLTSSPFYTAAGSAKKFNPYGAYNDILAGSNGTCKTCYATAGYDFVTGLGSPRAKVLAPFLAGQ